MWSPLTYQVTNEKYFFFFSECLGIFCHLQVVSSLQHAGKKNKFWKEEYKHLCVASSQFCVLSQYVMMEMDDTSNSSSVVICLKEKCKESIQTERKNSSMCWRAGTGLGSDVLHTSGRAEELMISSSSWLFRFANLILHWSVVYLVGFFLLFGLGGF